MIIDEIALASLRQNVKEQLSDKRYQHTLGVEQMAKHLGESLIPEKVSELRAAALLHDIAKELSYEEQVRLVRSSNVTYTEEDILTKPALHSIAAVPVIIRHFPDYATKDILSAVANHTLGADNMSVFDEIIFISDYAEAGRTYPTCQRVHGYLMENIRKSNSYEENLKILHITSLSSLESTIESLTRRNEVINTRTFATKQYLERSVRK